MQKSIRINESQLIYLASKARIEGTLTGSLWKRSADTGKWQQRWFALYQNLLFYYENDACLKASGVALLEGCYCERIVAPGSSSGKNRDIDKQYCFAISYRKEGQRHYELRTETESECTIWMEAILQASFSKVQEQKEQLEQKHLHLLQILDTERQSKWHYVQQTEELSTEVRKLKSEIRSLRRDRHSSGDSFDAESDEIRKIKKVQSFFRGWLCRRRWKQIVELYIRSDHAESMRKRNSIVFSLVECEEEYVKQLSTLVSVFLRPLRMAASSKNPPITHEDVNSIFLNSETLLFLHQIFLKGLLARMENWPTIVLDLFDMLLPMLVIYQEYVRNHHYSLQVLAEYKQKPDFNQLLRRYEEKSVCEGRSLANFLTYPMHQVPRYIITIHQLLAHTPHDHVERRSLEFALSKLEEISQVMQDEVSETENIRKNLSIERMIVEGCDILLDVNQTFVRQGSLIQVTTDAKSRTGLGRLGSFSSSFKEGRKEIVRMAFLFTNHLLLTTRASNGRLHLAKNYGKIPLSDCTLTEDTALDFFNFDDDSSSYDSSLSLVSQNSAGTTGNLLSTPGGGGDNSLSTSRATTAVDYNGLDFRITMDSRSGPPVTITLVASTLQEKAAWCSDISQCIENLHCSDILNGSMSDTSSVAMPQSVRTDPKLFRDDVDIKFSRSLNSCKVPQIRHASVERLLDRLTDLRFLSIDFLNTFLLTYRVFTTGRTVMEALKRVYRNPEFGYMDSTQPSCGGQHQPLSCRLSFDADDTGGITLGSASPPPIAPPPCTPSIVHDIEFTGQLPPDSKYLMKPLAERLRRLSTGSMRIEVAGGSGVGVSNDKGPSAVSQQQQQQPSGPQPATVRIGSELTSTPSGFRKYERPDSCPGSSSTSSAPVDHLSLPKPKLAPIASCETLSESYEQLACSESSESSLENSPIGSMSDDSMTASTSAMITITTSSDSAFSSLHRATIVSPRSSISSEGKVECSRNEFRGLLVPSCSGGVVPSMSSETLTGSTSSQVLSTAASSDTLVPGSPARSYSASPTTTTTTASTPTQSTGLKRSLAALLLVNFRGSSSSNGSSSGRKSSRSSSSSLQSHQLNALALSPATSPKFGQAPSSSHRRGMSQFELLPETPAVPAMRRATSPSPLRSPVSSPKLCRAPSPISYSYSSPNIITNLVKTRSYKPGSTESELSVCNFSPRSSCTVTMEGSSPTAKVGTVVTSSRASKRRSSSTAATVAFAAATAGSASNIRDHSKCTGRCHHSMAGNNELKPYCGHNKKRESVISTAATMRVLNILRHWVSKHSQDFDTDPELKVAVKELLEEMVNNSCLLPAEHKAASSILCVLIKDDEVMLRTKVNLELLLAPPESPSKDTFDTLSALDIAEQMTYLDHQIFMAINSEELLGQAWMKPDKAIRAPHVLLVSRRFNEASCLVVSEIVRRTNLQDRASCIEKWAAIADICRCMHNYNGVLQICAAFVNSAIYRLRKTWEKIPKQTRQMVERLQTLVSSDGRFKNMRDALHRCDPPCIPYLGMYLTDLSFIEEGTSNTTDDGLINFSKMRMITHVIKEIQLFQQTPYRIEHHRRVTNYLLDPSRLLDEEQTFRYSLEIEPRTARISSVSGQST